ncbi:MAG: ABC transporter permease [Mesorhizobium sp.]|uniref:ABC transporter permease n=1 Tax=Mesorhizobium sp. TaxID=1871066 RepID=UPI000FE8D8E5|nr:ABC transporter permease [Mesorhizobium sp.]RWI63646.1 MAG: ABC transporter permease [Mesorhizobium sp.]RWJ42710.1 MAG: ABC transporter permease [Mesorhizobium sp.]RWJ58115.1 MAG: ABC transporter permease [Mesorhizobium sp.]RWJ63981.1 MAG: ABC transporter permease [Mesorhizobium sp.]RWJ93858.1 MAG: ABC transporter permease [Mesorhizobium sp.]
MFFLSRTLRSAFTLWAILTMVFVATRLTGDPTYYLMPAELPEQQRVELREKLGLNDDIATQYLRYGAAIVQGDFGRSFFSNRSVVDLFFERVPNTLLLTIPAFLLSVGIGLCGGICAALRHNGLFDRALTTATVVMQAIPNFAVGIAAILIFSLSLRLLPSGGMGTWKHLILPVITLGLGTCANVAHLVRSNMLEVLGQDYIRYARSKGLSPAVVVLKHGLRNAILPVLTILGLQFGGLVAGAVVTETVFAWPGVGRLVIDAVMKRDFALLQFGILVFSAAIIFANLLVDLAYGLLDPRVRGK